MALRIGDTAPDLEADSTQGRLRFHEWIGDPWAVLVVRDAPRRRRGRRDDVHARRLGLRRGGAQDLPGGTARTAAVAADRLAADRGALAGLRPTRALRRYSAP